MSDLRKCYTLEITGGEPFEIFVPLSYALKYKGSMVLWKVVETPLRVAQIVEFIGDQGCSVRLFTEDKPEGYE